MRFLDVEDPFGLQAGSTRNLSVHSMTRYAWVGSRMRNMVDCAGFVSERSIRDQLDFRR